MTSTRALLAVFLTGLLSTAVWAQAEAEEAGVEVVEARTSADDGPAAYGGSHEDHAAHSEHARSMTVHAAPEEASATLDHVTWDLLSRVAATFLSGNRAELLSGNKPELLSQNETKLASENDLEVFSGNEISVFSNIRIEIHISGVPNPAEMMGGPEIRVEARRSRSDESRRERRPENGPRQQMELELRRPPARDLEEPRVEEGRNDEPRFLEPRLEEPRLEEPRFESPRPEPGLSLPE